jgi:hypothetical protein
MARAPRRAPTSPSAGDAWRSNGVCVGIGAYRFNIGAEIEG